MGDPVEPGPQRDRLVGAADSVDRRDQRLLDDVLGLVAAADDPGAVGEEAVAIALHHLLDGGDVAVADRLDEQLVRSSRACVLKRTTHGAAYVNASAARLLA